MKYSLKSRVKTAVTIDGLGVLQPGQTLEVGEERAAMFKHVRGLPLDQARLPQGVELIVVEDAEAAPQSEGKKVK